MKGWRQRFSRPVRLKDGTELATLAEARAWAIKVDNGRNEFQSLAGKLMAAAEGGSVEEARAALFNAAFLTFRLDMKSD